MKLLLCLLMGGWWCFGQTKEQAEKAAQVETQELTAALAEAGNSPVDFIRALEKHAAKYPNSPQMQNISRALYKSSVETKDDARILRYGEQVLVKEPDDLQVLDRVTRILLLKDDRESANRAMGYALRYEHDVEKLAAQPPAGSHYSAAQWKDEVDKGLSRAFVYEARATGNRDVGDGAKIADAVALAQRSWESYPTAAGAREWGRWLAKAGKPRDAVEHIAEAFAIEDSASTEVDRGKDRIRMGELYQKATGSEKGLGDVVLAAYDRTSALMNERIARLKQQDPNVAASKIMEFTLQGVDGKPLVLSTLRGKTVVFDFWATWCGPCRAQHPLCEQVKARFKGNTDVVFLAVATDEDRTLVEPFLKQQKWPVANVFFEAGMSRVLEVSSIPTTIVVDKAGNIASRMNGFVPERFADLLTDRINQTLAAKPAGQ